MDLQKRIDLVPKILSNFDKVIYWQDKAKQELIKWFLSNEHILIEALPWLWKTELIKSMADSIWYNYKRIQWTPDLMPQDILWYTTIWWRKIEWSIMTQLLLVDEINRINPKTLSALISAMSEKLIVDVDSWQAIYLPKEFLVIATQNPVETVWTFELPEATKDRFSIKIVMKKEANTLVNAYKLNDDEIPCKISNNLFDIIDKVFDNLDPFLTKFDYIKESFKNWPSIRAWLHFIKMAKVTAFINARDFVIIDDIKQNIVWVFSDKINLSDEYEYIFWSVADVLEKYIWDIDNL